jgi:mxaD protein
MAAPSRFGFPLRRLLCWKRRRNRHANLHVLPVSFYTAALAVKQRADGGSEMQWSGRFLRGDTGKAPLKNLDGAASLRAMTAFMRAGLEGVKLKAEGRGR